MSTPRLLSNRYELGDTLGYGGMSEVHHGHDVRLGREVAVKILRADLARDPQFQERFRREAQNAAALNHPAIVAVYDTGEANTEYGPLPYIVMEYVEGRTLRDIVKTEGPMSQKRAMEVMADVCAALDFSHRHGIVHRDVKPANIMITRNGAVKVMDFGIARAIHDGQAAMTQTAAVIGTAQYLSPEQARGEAVDARSDVYAAGCVLYELITGEPPFTGDSPVAVAYQHVREDPTPPSAVNPAVSPELDAVVLKALAKGPANRYQSSAEMRSDLVRTLSGQRPSAPMVMSEDERTQVMNSDRRQPPSYDDYDGYEDYEDEEDPLARRRRRNLIATALVVVGLLVAVLVMWLAGLFGTGKTDTATIPQGIVGQTEAAAKDTLRQAGFSSFAPVKYILCNGTVQNGLSCSDDGINRVLAVDPQQGSNVPKTTTITLTEGQAPGKVQVPSLLGLNQADATSKLQSVGLTLGNVTQRPVTDPTQYGMVLDQDPSSGSSVDPNSKVDITIGQTPPEKTPPDERGKQYADAKKDLEKAGFVVSRQDVDSNQPQNTVVSQSPVGAPVPVGSTITLSVSNGSQATFSMPDVTGRSYEQAVAILQNAGWAGQAIQLADYSGDPSNEGQVSRTDPPAGTQVSRSQTITFYIVSSGGGGPSPSTSRTAPHFP